MKTLRDYIDLLNEVEAAQPAAAPAAAPATPAAAPAPAQQDPAKKAAIDQIKKFAATPTNAMPRLGWAIDPNTGIIYYENGSSESGNGGPGKMAPYGEAGKFWDFNSPAGANSEAGKLGTLVRQAGLEVVAVPQKGLFGTYNVAGVDPSKLANIDKVEAPAAEPAAEPGAVASPVTTSDVQGQPLPPAAEPAAPTGVNTQPAAPTTPAKPNDNVLYIQQTLKRLGADLGTTGPNKDGVDGIMGPKTKAMMAKYNIDANGKNIAKPNPNAPATGTQSNAVTTAAAAGNRAQDVETGGGAFMGNTNIMQADAKIAKQVANAPIDPATGKPVDWPKWSLNQRRVYNNLEREKARAGAQPVVPANQTPPQPGTVVREMSKSDSELLDRMLTIAKLR